MIKKLIRKEVTVNTFIEDGELNIEDEKKSKIPIHTDNYATFRKADAKFNNWYKFVSEQVLKFNQKKNKVDKKDLENLASTNIDNVSLDDLITLIKNPTFYIEFLIKEMKIFENKIIVVFELNQYVIEEDEL